MAQFKITEVLTTYQKNPMGLDHACPVFSWKVEAKGQDYLQGAYQIFVGSEERSDDMWDSGRVESDASTGIKYLGTELRASTRYYITLTVWDQNGETAVSDEYWFETGLLDPSIQAWDGGTWIGAPEKYFSTDTMGVFVLDTDITLSEGSKRAGIVFGADDPRLMDTRKNQYEIAGENYIRYELNVETIPAKLDIYRVGYAPQDTDLVPFASVPVIPFVTPEKGSELEKASYGKNPNELLAPAEIPADKLIITEENRYQKHHLRIACEGNSAYCYVDGVMIDAMIQNHFFGARTVGRQLNPLDFNDITTFPRLCSIGYFVGEEDKAEFSGIAISNYRTPKAQIAHIDADGITLEGCDEDGDAAEVQVIMDPSEHSIPMFRRNFKVYTGKELVKARLYITARGIYDCRINGQAVTETLYNPGHTQYNKHIVYQTYDVLDCLQKGENGIGVTLASGWWCDAQTFVVDNYNYYGDRESFLTKLVLTYEDGEQKVITTKPEEWDYFGEGPYLYSGFFNGEHVDARKMDLYKNFSKPDFDLKAIGAEEKKAVEIVPASIEESFMGMGSPWPALDYSDVKIVGGVNAPVVEVTTVKAEKMMEPRKGLYIYDLGQEIAGVPKIRLKGEAGTLVTIRYCEMLYPELPEYGNLHGTMLTENYRDAESIDKYILRGDANGEIFHPKFTFHGFRYIEVSGVEEAPALEDVIGIQVSSIPEITGCLETSNPLLNRFIENVKWSQLCNFISIPTDCPQRNERMGWAGDTHVFTRCATYQSDAHLFYYRYLEALRDLQEESGKLPDVAPAGGGFGGITYESAMILMTWELYQQYGDLSVVEEYYDAMKTWMTYIKSKGLPGPVFVGPLGDWLAPKETDLFSIFNCFYGRDAELMSKMAAALGKEEDAALYASEYQASKAFWNGMFVDPETKMAKGIDGKINDTQCAYALPLACRMVSEENQEAFYEHLARITREVGTTVSTGFFGTGVLNPMLSEGGYTDIAYELIQQTAFPSWLYPVTQGATTIWERWNSYTIENGFGGNNSMNSFNHYSLGSVLAWIYEDVLGIKRDEAHPGYKHFTLKPSIQSLDYAKGGFETEYGRINSGWERSENGYSYHCTIPANTTATLILPSGTYELGSGEYTF